MRIITIRQFQQNLYSELKNLPFIVTRKGIKEFVVTKYAQTTAQTPQKVIPLMPVVKKENMMFEI